MSRCTTSSTDSTVALSGRSKFSGRAHPEARMLLKDSKQDFVSITVADLNFSLTIISESAHRYLSYLRSVYFD